MHTPGRTHLAFPCFLKLNGLLVLQRRGLLTELLWRFRDGFGLEALQLRNGDDGSRRVQRCQ